MAKKAKSKAKKPAKKARSKPAAKKAAAKRSSAKVMKLKPKMAQDVEEERREVDDAVALEEAVRPGRQGARRRAHSRLHACAVGSDLHPAARLVRRRRDQGRASGRRRHHARPAGRREGRGFALLHHAQPQQAFDHDRLQAPAGQARARRADQELRRAGREFRARRARSHGPDLGAHPQAQPAHDRGVGQGLRPRTLRGLQGLRERRAMHRRLGLDHRLPRRSAAGHRRADRRQRHGPASRARHRVGALSAHPHRPRPEGAVRDAGRRAQSRARQAARSAAPEGMARSPNTPSMARAFRSATRRRAPATIPVAASPAGF